jgi:ABC-2 type transport system permease protein
MNWNRAAAVVLRQLYLMRGSPARVLPMFAWVCIDIVLWGFITRYFNAVMGPGMNLVATLLGAVLLWDFFSRVMHGVTMAFFEDVWSRNFLNLFASPLSISEYVSGLILSSVLTSAVGLIAMMMVARIVFGLSFASYGLPILAFLTILFLFGVALGVLGCAVVLRLGPAAEWLIWPIPALVSPFIGVFYPLSTLPVWMQYVARVLPPSYVFEEMRRIITHRGAFSGSALAVSFVLVLVDIVIAGWYFVRVYKHSVRTGLIARYSAETVS